MDKPEILPALNWSTVKVLYVKKFWRSPIQPVILYDRVFGPKPFSNVRADVYSYVVLPQEERK
jgi:hypothetical protein